MKWKVSSLAFRQQSEVFRLSKRFPHEEQYSLTNQIRRSSRSVCANLAEAFGKRRYVALLISKFTDANGENHETETWLDIAVDCEYVAEEETMIIRELNKEIGKLLYYMTQNASKFSHQG
jgi:four helix bundle protein